jgi:RNA polymerase sigma-70 factor (ECF subfamily)
MPADERGWVRRFRSGDPSGFDALYAAYGNRIYRFCHRLCGRAADAEDLAQEVFLAAFQGRERFDGRSTVATWLYRIALYRWRRLFGGARIETVLLDESVPATAPDPAASHLDQLALEEAVTALPDPLREAFILVKAEGLKYREAAQVLGIPQGTVQSRVHDAVVRLRAALTDDESTQPQPCGAPRHAM